MLEKFSPRGVVALAASIAAVTVYVVPLVWMVLTADTIHGVLGPMGFGVFVIAAWLVIGVGVALCVAALGGTLGAVMLRLQIAPTTTLWTVWSVTVATSVFVLSTLSQDNASAQAKRQAAETAVKDLDPLVAVRLGGGGDTPQARLREKTAAYRLAVAGLRTGKFKGAKLRSAVLAVLSSETMTYAQPAALKLKVFRQLIAQGQYVTLLKQRPLVAFDLLEGARGTYQVEALRGSVLQAVADFAEANQSKPDNLGWHSRRVASLCRLRLGGVAAIQGVASTAISLASRYQDPSLGPVVVSAALALSGEVPDDAISTLGQLALLPLRSPSRRYISGQTAIAQRLIRRHREALRRLMPPEDQELLVKEAGCRRHEGVCEPR